MKFTSLPLNLTTTQRADYNKKVLAAIRNRKGCKYTPEEVYNYFTGKGQLHNLYARDFASFHEYTQAKKEIEKGQFFTPDSLCAKIVTALKPGDHFLISDITCGKGSFFNFLPVEKNCYGCELDPDAYAVSRFLFPDAHIRKGDFVYYNTTEKMDLVIGNPPFNLSTDKGVSQWVYLQQAYNMLQFNGLVAVIVPLNFLSDELLDKRKIEWLNHAFHFVLQCQLPVNAFKAVIDTKLLILQKKGLHTTCPAPYQVDNFVSFDPAQIYEKYIEPIYQFNKTNAARLRLFTMQHAISDNTYQEKITKALYDIKCNPKLRKAYYKKAVKRIEEIHTKQKPAGISEKDWENQKPTAGKVYAYLRSIIKNQNDPAPRKEVKIVKTAYGLRLKAYHPTLKKMQWEKSMHDMVLTGETFNPFKKLYRKKQKAYGLQTTPFVSMERDKTVDAYLNRLRLRPKWQKQVAFSGVESKVIALNAMQKADLGLLFQKRYAILAWEQGGGKSVAGMAWLNYWKDHYRNAFVLAPALAIETTWTQQLSIYGFDFIKLETISDIANIQPGQIVLVSYERLINLQRFIKGFIKRAAYKHALLVDESDELTNAGSLRSLAALNCFRKGKLKLLTTGTTTRNTINEIYTQLELVYNNSTAFRCWAPTKFVVDENGDLKEVTNDLCGYPFPAYYGKTLFKQSFCPNRVTVFGISQETQDIYNSTMLKDLVAQTIITRKFEEIVGEKKYSIHTHTIKQSSAEKTLYHILMTEFLSVCYQYYTSTGNTRKDAALRLIRQIKALIKATSTPQLMPHYQGRELPQKYREVVKLVTEWKNEPVTIGTIFKTAARSYYELLKKQFPHRQVFYIDGEIPVAKRKEILEKFRQSEKGILVCTQQSLKSSVNIPFCNKVIIEALQWNIPRISQFYFRFIRFDSPRHTEVHFITYGGTIETNLLALLMAKEKLNDFIKTTNEKTSEAIYKQFGIDLNILNDLIKKEWDSEGRLQLRWGNQTLN